MWRTTFSRILDRNVRNGAVFFQKIFVKRWLFQQRSDDGSLQITWYNASGKGRVDDVRDGQGFHKEAWWEWDQVHKTWQIHC